MSDFDESETLSESDIHFLVKDECKREPVRDRLLLKQQKEKERQFRRVARSIKASSSGFPSPAFTSRRRSSVKTEKKNSDIDELYNHDLDIQLKNQGRSDEDIKQLNSQKLKEFKMYSDLVDIEEKQYLLNAQTSLLVVSTVVEQIATKFGFEMYDLKGFSKEMKTAIDNGDFTNSCKLLMSSAFGTILKDPKVSFIGAILYVVHETHKKNQKEKEESKKEDKKKKKIAKKKRISEKSDMITDPVTKTERPKFESNEPSDAIDNFMGQVSGLNPIISTVNNDIQTRSKLEDEKKQLTKQTETEIRLEDYL
jgi:hypothetical protein